MLEHCAIVVDNQTHIEKLAQEILSGKVQGFERLKAKKGLLFSNEQIEQFIWEEEQHDRKELTQESEQTLRSMSSGERKKSLLQHLLVQNPEFLVLVNPFDHLDSESQQFLKERFLNISKSISLIQLVGRANDILPDTKKYGTFKKGLLKWYKSKNAFWDSLKNNPLSFSERIPNAVKANHYPGEELVTFKDVSVSYDGRPILDQINWTIRKGEFWQLMGPNGSGKTTLLTMITGDNLKGYGQDLTLFGHKKGSGESVWDLKEQIGYFTPSMVDQFRGYHSALNMIISGLHDSIGLYTEPSDTEVRTAYQWLRLVNLGQKREELFKTLSTGEKRLVMLARAMIKHPPLLILDEPTAGLDDSSAAFFISLVNKIAEESDSAIVFVSHRREKNLNPKYIMALKPEEDGSVGLVKKM
ncbi:ATP-binding cassette domain-containing protein [Flagellimonas allohymeniacidonis]|uniref:ATP-binding cassette domain-containing protein n=1 Tax=Flagellimonas allohymeniacidonis TaxID=2517819 RepID=A0A4V2HSY4_9FLAO|nr:ATP-binding cassette domain-containing protein [Allomuricauda hymeniacidonis]TAI49530.1 ATP-binding cassette domain-containing protein [Allomuricauda hymeniacidonis]